MELILIVSLLILGTGILRLVGANYHISEYIGIGGLLAMGTATFIYFVFAAIGVKLLPNIFLLTVILFGSLLHALSVFVLKKPFIHTEFKSAGFISIPINPAWYVLVGLVAYAIYAIGVKSVFWPVFDYDANTGFDAYGMMIANEGTMKVKIFEFVTQNREVARFLYPPYVALSSAIAYTLNINSTFMPPLQYAFLAFAFYGLIRSSVSPLAATLGTLALIFTPEMLAHAALIKTNMPNASFAGLAVVLAAVWVAKSDCKYLILSALFAFFSCWSRTDGIAAAGAVAAVVGLHSILQKKWLRLAWFIPLSLVGYFIWSFFIKNGLKMGIESFFTLKLNNDPEKNKVFATYLSELFWFGFRMYGIAWLMFFIVLAINITKLREKATWSLLAMIFIAWFGLTFIYYQASGVIDTPKILMENSYKRGIFIFLPMVWYFVFASPLSKKLFGFVQEKLKRA